MSKKMIVFIELLLCAVSIVVVSIFGNVAESWRSTEYCKSLVFVNGEDYAIEVVCKDIDGNMTTDESLCVKKEKIIKLTEGQTSIQLAWEIGPENATNASVRFEKNNNNVIISESGLVSSVTQETGGVTITIITMDGTSIKDSITIQPYFSSQGGEIVFD